MLENINLFFEDDFELDGPTEADEMIEFGGNGRYTTKVAAPHYTPNGPCPSVSELYNYSKYEDLIKEINASNVSDDEKTLLKLAATRHIIFNFSKIANYYAYASKEMQELMEHSAMVIIDFNDAVKAGFVKLDKRIDEFINAQLAMGKENEDEG